MDIFEYLAAQYGIFERGKSKTVQKITESAAEATDAYIIPQVTGLLVLLLDLVMIKLPALNPDFHGVFFSRVYTYRPISL